jgi:hypothetical protein
MRSNWTRRSLSVWLAAMTLMLGGCGEEKKPPAVKPVGSYCTQDGWCTEHNIPEEICAQCKPNVAAEYKTKGDWCQKHNRPKSQCFLCDPKLEAKFIAEYEAKHGKKPPVRTGNS